MLAPSMRASALLLVLLLPLSLVLVPSAAAACSGSATVDTGVVYVVQGQCFAGDSPLVVTVGPVHDAGVGISGCSFGGPFTSIWLESNGIPGLQTGGPNPDTLLFEGIIGRQSHCPL